MDVVGAYTVEHKGGRSKHGFGSFRHGRKRDDEGCGRGEGIHPPVCVSYILECRFKDMWIT